MANKCNGKKDKRGDFVLKVKKPPKTMLDKVIFYGIGGTVR